MGHASWTKAWQWPAAGHSTNVQITPVPLDLTSNAAATTTATRIPLTVGRKDVSLAKVKFAPAALGNLTMELSMEDRFSQTREGGFYDYSWTANVTLTLPTGLRVFPGMPASVNVLWTTSHNYPHYNGKNIVANLDVSKVLTNAVLAWSALYYAPSHRWTYWIMRAVGILRPSLGNIIVSMSSQDTYSIDVSDAPHYEHTIAADLAVDRVGLQAILPDDEWQASILATLPSGCECVGCDCQFDVITADSPSPE